MRQIVQFADSIPPSHAAEFFALLSGGQRDALWDGSLAPVSRLAILPGYDALQHRARQRNWRPW